MIKSYDNYAHETGQIYWFLIPVGKNICDKLGQECQGIYALYKLNNKGLIEYTDNRCYVDTTQTNELGKKNHILNNKIFACEWFNGTAFVWNKYLKRVKIPPQIENQTKYATMGYFAYDNKGFLTETDEKIGINEYFNSFTFSSIAPEFTYNPILLKNCSVAKLLR